MDFEELKSKWDWSPIRNCPGRFIWRGNSRNISPEEIAGAEIELREFRTEKAIDTVIAGRITGGGIISYRKKDGTYLHTLNTIEGFERKLTQLGIRF